MTCLPFLFDIELTYAFGYLASFSARKLLRLCRSVTSRFLSIFPTGMRGSAVMISMCSGGPLGDQAIDLAGCDASHTCPSLTAESLGPVHERGQLWLGKTPSTPEVAPVTSPGNAGARLASGNGHRCVRARAAAPDPLGFLMIDNARC